MVGSREVLGIFGSAIDVLLTTIFHELAFLVNALQIILVTIV
jgi:hypothetical protein